MTGGFSGSMANMAEELANPPVPGRMRGRDGRQDFFHQHDFRPCFDLTFEEWGW